MILVMGLGVSFVAFVLFFLNIEEPFDRALQFAALYAVVIAVSLLFSHVRGRVRPSGGSGGPERDWDSGDTFIWLCLFLLSQVIWFGINRLREEQNSDSVEISSPPPISGGFP